MARLGTFVAIITGLCITLSCQEDELKTNDTFSFFASVLTYDHTAEDFELTSAHISISSGSETLSEMDLEATANTLRVKEGLDTYTVTVTKDAYLPYEKIFSATELKQFGSDAPLVITLLDESLSGGLIAWYPFNGNADDQSGNELDGTVHEAVLTTDRKGSPDAAYLFDGTNDRIAVPHNALLNLSGDFTISLWAEIASDQEPHGGVNDILRKWNGDAAGYPFAVSYLNPLADDLKEGKILYARYDGQACGNSSTGYSPVVENDTFLHLVVVRDGDVLRNYVDNVLIEEVTDVVSCSVENTADVTIGCRGNLMRFFKGKIDDIRIYDRVLSNVEISNLYQE